MSIFSCSVVLHCLWNYMSLSSHILSQLYVYSASYRRGCVCNGNRVREEKRRSRQRTPSWVSNLFKRHIMQRIERRSKTELNWTKKNIWHNAFSLLFQEPFLYLIVYFLEPTVPLKAQNANLFCTNLPNLLIVSEQCLCVLVDADPCGWMI